MTLAREVIEQLLRPINERRVSRRDGMSHLESYDVRAHLDRVFGFAEWSGDVLDITPLYEVDVTLGNGKPGWSVAYRCTYRLTIHATGATYTETATGDGKMPDSKRSDAHDFAIKTAESQAFKRCAINLGDQFGLSLYQKGSTMALVGRTLNMPTSGDPTDTPSKAPVDEHVTEVAPEDSPVGQAEPETPPQPAPAAAPARQGTQTADAGSPARGEGGRTADAVDSPPPAASIVADLRDKALAATKKPELLRLLMEVGKSKVGEEMTSDESGRGMSLEALINARIREVAA